MVFAGFRYAENFEMDVGGMRISIRRFPIPVSGGGGIIYPQCKDLLD